MTRLQFASLCLLAATVPATAAHAQQGATPATGATPPAATAEPSPSAAAPPQRAGGTSPPQPAASARPAARGSNARAMDRLELDTTQITGNRELPKVMVVVPWKKSDIGDLVGKPVNSLVDEALEPVDREVFRREVDYYGALAPDRPAAARSETGVTPAAAAPGAEK